MSGLAQVPQVNSLFNNHAGLLGSRRHDLPVGGKIRPGIKVLTPKASRDERAVRIYAAGTETGKDFDTIEAEIRAAAPGLGGPLMPTNTPYFTVWGRDFGMPEIARLILDKFGEDRGDGAGRQLYRFPVIFPADDPDMILPHALRCWGSGQLKYWSEYTPTGTLTCRQYVPIKVVDGKREFKPFGGRKTMPREENGGVCDPEQCREYQADECKLNGSMRFFIPGIPSIHAFELPTTSWYSLSNIRKTLENIARNRGGRVSGYLYADRTFWIAKRLQPVSRITKEGKAVRELKWLIVLEGDVDMGALLLEHSAGQARLALADTTAAALNDGTIIDGEVTPRQNGAAAPVETPPEAGPVLIENDAAAVKRLRSEVHHALQPLNVPPLAFTTFMRVETSNEQWSVTRGDLERAKAMLGQAQPAPGELLGRITNSLKFEVKEQLITEQVPDDVFTQYVAKRVHDERWNSQLPHLCKALEIIAEYRGRGQELIDQMSTELDLG